MSSSLVMLQGGDIPSMRSIGETRDISRSRPTSPDPRLATLMPDEREQTRQPVSIASARPDSLATLLPEASQPRPSQDDILQPDGDVTISAGCVEMASPAGGEALLVGPSQWAGVSSSLVMLHGGNAMRPIGETRDILQPTPVNIGGGCVKMEVASSPTQGGALLVGPSQWGGVVPADAARGLTPFSP